MLTATDLYTLLYRDVQTEEIADLCAISTTDLNRICAELEEAGIAKPAGDSWIPGPNAQADVFDFQKQIYGLGLDLELRHDAS